MVVFKLVIYNVYTYNVQACVGVVLLKSDIGTWQKKVPRSVCHRRCFIETASIKALKRTNFSSWCDIGHTAYAKYVPNLAHFINIRNVQITRGSSHIIQCFIPSLASTVQHRYHKSQANASMTTDTAIAGITSRLFQLQDFLQQRCHVGRSHLVIWEKQQGTR